MGYKDLFKLTGPNKKWFRSSVDGLVFTVVGEQTSWGKPLGVIKRVTMHWSAGDYRTCWDHYHYCIVYDAEHDKAHVVRMLKLTQLGEHAKHANHGNVGVSFMGMRGADHTQHGKFPITPIMISVGARFVAELCWMYKLKPDKDVTDHEHVDREVGLPAGRRWDIRPFLPEFMTRMQASYADVKAGSPLTYKGILT